MKYFTSTSRRCFFYFFIFVATTIWAQPPNQLPENANALQSANTWIALEPTGVRPQERVSWQKLVYDEKNDKIWLFAAAGGETYRAYANDVWLYDLAANTWKMIRDISTAQDPPDQPSWRHAEQGRTFDVKAGVIILFGQQSAAGPKNDTWTYTVSTDVWKEMKPTGDVPPIPNHFEYALEYDRKANISVLFGGERQYDYPSDVWEYNLTQNRWQHYPFTAANASPGRRGHGMAYCDTLGGIIITGGGSGWTGVRNFNDVWLYAAQTRTWRALRNLNPPPARRQFSFDYDPFNRICLVFSGGVGEGSVSQLYNDTWVYYVTEGRWEKVQTATRPPLYGGGDMMIYARKHKAFYFMSDDGNLWKFQFSPKTNIDDTPKAPLENHLINNFPNPFNPSTKIYYHVAANAKSPRASVTLQVYDSLGRGVRRLVQELQKPGEYNVVWDGKNARGEELPSGVYLYELRIDDFKSQKKMSLVR